MRYKPFVGTSLKILVEIEDPKFLTYNSRGIDPADFALNSYYLPTNGGLVLFDPNYLRNVNIRTLHLAVLYKDLEAIKSHLEKGADVNQKNFDGKTPLHYANEFKLIEYLVEKGADINQTDRWGKTLLHYAVDHYVSDNNSQNFKIVKFLIEKGTDLNHQDEEKNTPLLIAANNKNYDVVEALLNAGC